MSPKMHMGLSFGIATIGAALVITMITTEGEPGALPLGLVLIGAVGYASGWMRQRSSLKIRISDKSM